MEIFKNIAVFSKTFSRAIFENKAMADVVN